MAVLPHQPPMDPPQEAGQCHLYPHPQASAPHMSLPDGEGGWGCGLHVCPEGNAPCRGATSVNYQCGSALLLQTSIVLMEKLRHTGEVIGPVPHIQ